jgi:hypothetical protein
MATINPTVTNKNDLTIVQWVNMANGDDGAPYAFTQWADRSVQVAGTFGAGGNAKWEGSNDGTNFGVLTDPQGNALDFTSAKIESVTELALKSRPRITAGDGTTSITVTLVAFNSRTARGG